MNRYGHFIGAALMLTAFQDPANAASMDVIRGLDANGNGVIDRGAELEALDAIRGQLTGEQLVTYEIETAKPDFQGIPVERFEETFAVLLTKTCAIEKRFFLQEDVSDFSLVRPSLFKPTGTGATLMVGRNNLTNITSWSLSGAAAFIAPGSKRCLTSDRLRGAAVPVLTGYAFAPYVLFDGSGSSNNRGPSNLTFGVKSEFQLFGGVFDLQEISANPYYRTDFDGQASIPGLQVVWKPYLINARLNGYRIPDDGLLWWWTFSARGDFSSVNKAGRSGLVQGTEYGWIGIKAGAQAKWNREGAVPMYANVNFEALRDVMNDNSAELLTAAVGFRLDRDERTALELSYKRGSDYLSSRKFDGLTLSLKLAF